MDNSVKSEKSLKQSCQHGGCPVVCLSFPLATGMSLDLVSILLVDSICALFSDMVSLVVFFLPRGLALCLTHLVRVGTLRSVP